jgi:peroxin-19
MNFGGDGGNDVHGVLESLMGQLMSKEVLYEPLKELHQKVEFFLELARQTLTSFSVPRIFRGE